MRTNLTYITALFGAAAAAVAVLAAPVAAAATGQPCSATGSEDRVPVARQCPDQ